MKIRMELKLKKEDSFGDDGGWRGMDAGND